MIVKFFKTGTSNAEPAIRYLLGEKNHTGEERTFKPEILEGSAELTTNIIGSSQFFRQFRPLNVVDNCARNGWGSTTRCLNVAECGCSRTRHTQRPGP